MFSITPQRLVAATAAVLLITASTGFGAIFALGTGSRHGITLGLLSVAMALGLELAKPIAIEATLLALRSFAVFTRRTVKGLALDQLHSQASTQWHARLSR